MSSSEPVVHEKEGAWIRGSVSAEMTVERGQLGIAVLGIVVTIGLTVGIGFDATWWIGSRRRRRELRVRLPAENRQRLTGRQRLRA